MKPLDRLVKLYERRYLPLLGAFLAVTALAAVLALRLGISADLERLLPEDAPSVAGLRELQGAYASQIGRLTVVLQGPQPERLRLVAHALAGELEGIPGVQRVELERPEAHFHRWRLLYIDQEDLQDIVARVERRVRWEQSRQNPLFGDLGGAPPEELDLADIEARYGPQRRGHYYASGDGRLVALFLFPDFPAEDLGRAEELVDRVRRHVDKVLQEDRWQGVSYELTGRYQKRVEQQDVLYQDLRLATIIATVSLLAFLMAYFRSFWSAVLVILPLGMGTVWAFAWAALVFGQLNILTGFLGSILLGLGVDYGIHLVSRFHDARLEGHPPGASLAFALGTAGRASLYAGLTTLVALGSLALSSFRAFYEFGVIALGGMTLILLAYATVFPILVLALGRFAHASRPPLSGTWSRALAKGLEGPGVPLLQRGVRLRRVQRIAASALVVAAMAAALGMGGARWERDFRTLQVTGTPTWRLDEQVNRLLDQSQTPAVVLADSPAQAHFLAGELRARRAAGLEGRTLADIYTLEDLVPAAQQARWPLLQRLARALERAAASDEAPARIEELRREVAQILARGPLGVEDLPDSLRLPFLRSDDARKAVVLVFPAIDLNDADEVRAFARALRDLPTSAEPGAVRRDAISDALLLADIADYVERDTLWMTIITLLGLVAVAALAFGRLREVVLVTLTVGLAILCAIGLSGLLGVPFNFVNLIIVPMWMGLGVDASFHMYLRLEEEPERLQPLFSLALSVAAAFLTSMIGFGSMLVTHHAGLYSMGQMAVLGLGTILVVHLVLLVFFAVTHQLHAVSRAGVAVSHQEPPPPSGRRPVAGGT